MHWGGVACTAPPGSAGAVVNAAPKLNKHFFSVDYKLPPAVPLTIFILVLPKDERLLKLETAKFFIVGLDVILRCLDVVVGASLKSTRTEP